MSFNQNEVDTLLADCRRCCCICHKFCGVHIELHHADHRSEGGSDDIENAIPLCFDCHAEVGHYNSDHPRGRKFTAEELRKHKKNWLEQVSSIGVNGSTVEFSRDVGAIQSMSDELQYNLTVLTNNGVGLLGSTCQVNFERAIKEGVIKYLPDETRNKVMIAYASSSKYNRAVEMYIANPPSATNPTGTNGQLTNIVSRATTQLQEALRLLTVFINESPSI
ncbi:MAG: HNH endonuclease [Candidatus Doudnabacteria bacterium]|nr:HNH endonuclease [Candidatus Doudnabacteria bacterium]